MVTGQLNRLGRQLRDLMFARERTAIGDRDLIERFLLTGDESAFEALVRRHGPMVLGVCRRVLHDPHDAEDAFQATFIVLLRKMSSITQPDLVANWLYGVACRTAKEARGRLARHRSREQQAMNAEPENRVQGDSWADVRPLLDEELSKLPDKYRVPVVLCDLQSLSRKEVAEQIGCPEGTLSSRLARARDLLRERLTRRGITVSACVMATLLQNNAASAALPTPLVISTVQAALAGAASTAAAGAVTVPAALAEGVLRTMFMTKVKIAAAIVLTVGLIGVGTGVGVHSAARGFTAIGADGFAEAADEKPVAQREEKREAAPGVRGIIKSVDAEKKTITVTVRFEGEKAVEDHTVALSPDVKIVIVDVPQAKIADLKPRMQVAIRLSADEKSVVAIQEIRGEDPARRDVAERRDGDARATVFGIVKTVDPAKNTISITIPRDGGVQEERTLELSKEARFLIGRREGAKLTDVAAGMRVWLQMSDDRRAVIQVKAEEARGEPVRDPVRGEPARRPLSVNGTVKAIDPAKNTLTLAVQVEGVTFEKAFDLAKDVRVLEERLTLADIKAGSRVLLTLDEAGKTVTGIRPIRGDADRRPDAPREGDRKPDAPREGDRKPDAPRDGERKPDAPRDGDKE